jgi:DNA repair protein RadC
MEAFAAYVATQRPLPQSPEDTVRLMRPVLTPCGQEVMHALLLDAKNSLIADALLTTGLADRTQIHPREAFREAIRTSCSRLILVHNLCAAAHN